MKLPPLTFLATAFRGNEIDCGLIDRQGHETVPDRNLGKASVCSCRRCNVEVEVEAGAEKYDEHKRQR
jgi:hypothetical protein